MANRYWVGGTASWDGVVGTKWAEVDGGPGGFSVPTAADNVFFTAASGTSTVTIVTAAAICLNLDCTGFTGTLAGTTTSLQVYGNFTLSSAMTFSFTYRLEFLASTTGKTITTAGKAIPARVYFGGVSGTAPSGGWILQDAFNDTNASFGFGHTAGTLDLNGVTVTAIAFDITASTAKTLYLRNSTLNLSSTSSPWNFTDAAAPATTLDAGTSTINLTAISVASQIEFYGGGKTYYNVNFTGSTNYLVTGTNTFNGTYTASAYSTQYTQVLLAHKNTFNGTLATASTTGWFPVIFTSDFEGQAIDQVFNCTMSLGHVGFRDIRALGTTPIAATTIGNMGGCSNINFTPSRTVYYVGTAGSITRNVWSDTSNGTANPNFYPLPQDRAIINNSSPASISFSVTSTVPYIGTVDFSQRTTAITVNPGAAALHGDLILSSAVTMSGATDFTFNGPFNQTIYSNGIAFTSAFTSTKRHEGGLYLGDAFTSTDTTSCTIAAGKFDTNGFAFTAASLTCNTTIDLCEIYLRNSVCTFNSSAPISFGTTVQYNLIFDAGTSSIICNSSLLSTFAGNGATFYDVSFTSTAVNSTVRTISGNTTIRNLSIVGPATASIRYVSISDTVTITGALSVTGTAGNRRVQFISTNSSSTVTPNVPKTLIINGSTSLTDCDFEDIQVIGTAAPISGTRIGDLTRNSGITFSTPKTVYWNLNGNQNWSANGWAPNSGGTPSTNSFPLAQDTAVFNESGLAEVITFELPWNAGTIDTSARTTAVSLSVATTITANIRKDLICGSGLSFTFAGTGAWSFIGDNTQTITCNGVTLQANISINKYNKSILQLGSNLLMGTTRTLTLNRALFVVGAFDVTIGLFTFTNNANSDLKMGSGTWYITGAGVCWNAGGATASKLYKETANIVLDNNTTTARTFAGGGHTYNKVTIGGNTSISTTTITGSNCFSELASTKTVAHTIIFTAATNQRINKWSISGTAGNVVTLTSSSTTVWSLLIYGDRISADYLNVSYCSVSIVASFSTAEFYAGPNSTNTVGNIGLIFFTAPPAGRTLYWVGGTGTWDATAGTKWALSSGSTGGEAVPTSADNVIFDSGSSLSNAAYTVTIGTSLLVRCKDFTMSGPGGLNKVTLAGPASAIISCHGDFSMPGGTAGITRTFTGEIWLGGSGAHTFSTNGVALGGFVDIIAEDAEYTLASAIDLGTSTLFPIAGTLHTAGFTVSAAVLDMSFGTTYDFKRNLYCSNSVINLSSIATPLDLSSGLLSQNMNFYANTSTINFTGSYAQPVYVEGQTFYNVRYSSSSTNDASTIIYGQATYNNLTFDYTSATAVTKQIALDANCTVNGILTVFAPQNRSVAKTMIATPPLASDFNIGMGKTRYITLNGTANVGYCNFRDIAIVGPGAGITGPGIGDAGGNQGITFPAAKTVYWNLAGSQNWNANGWANTSGGSPNIDNFPAAHDTAVIDNSSAGTQVTFNENWHIGNINAASRSTAFTLGLGSAIDIQLYGDLNVGSGITLTGSYIYFRGRDRTQYVTLNNPNSNIPLSVLYVGTAGSNGTVEFTSTVNCNAVIRHYNGNINFGNNDVVFDYYDDITSTIPETTKVINFGQANVKAIGSSGQWIGATAANTITIVGENSTLTVDGSAHSFKAGLTYPTFISNVASTSIVGTNMTFKDIKISPAIANGIIQFTTGDAIVYVENFTMRGNTSSTPTISAQQATTEEIKIILKNRSYIETDYISAQGVSFYPISKAWYIGPNSRQGPDPGLIASKSAVGGAQFKNANEQTGFFTFFG